MAPLGFACIFVWPNYLKFLLRRGGSCPGSFGPPLFLLCPSFCGFACARGGLIGAPVGGVGAGALGSLFFCSWGMAFVLSQVLGIFLSVHLSTWGPLRVELVMFWCCSRGGS